MIQTVVSGRFAREGDESFSRLFDGISYGLIAASYIALNVALPLAAQAH
jgi:hypothetical protein